MTSPSPLIWRSGSATLVLRSIFPGVKRHRPLHLFLLRLHHSISLFLERLLSRQTSSLRLFFLSCRSHATTPSTHSLTFQFYRASRFVLFLSFFRKRTGVDRASRPKLTLPLPCFKTEVVLLYFNSLQFICSHRRCHFVRNRPRIHRIPRQFIWCSFIHSNESQSHSFCYSLTRRYFSHNTWSWFLIAWYSPLDSTQYTRNLTYIIIKWLTFSIISTISIKKLKYLISYQSSLRDYSLNLSEIMS